MVAIEVLGPAGAARYTPRFARGSDARIVPESDLDYRPTGFTDGSSLAAACEEVARSALEHGRAELWLWHSDGLGWAAQRWGEPRALGALLSELRPLRGLARWAADDHGADVALAGVIAMILARLRSEQRVPSRARLPELCGLGVALGRLEGELPTVAVNGARAPLQAIGGPPDHPAVGESFAQRRQRVAGAVVGLCDFDRAMVLRSRGGGMEAIATYFSHLDGWEREVHEQPVGQRMALKPRPSDSRRAWRRRPAVMIASAHDPYAWAPMVHRLEALSGASRPLMVGGEGVAVMHGISLVAPHSRDGALDARTPAGV